MDENIKRMIAARKQAAIDNLLALYSGRQLNESMANGIVGALRELVNLEKDYDRFVKEQMIDQSNKLSRLKNS